MNPIELKDDIRNLEIMVGTDAPKFPHVPETAIKKSLGQIAFETYNPTNTWDTWETSTPYFKSLWESVATAVQIEDRKQLAERILAEKIDQRGEGVNDVLRILKEKIPAEHKTLPYPGCPCEPDCPKCSGAYCETHGADHCECDVVARHQITKPAIPEFFLISKKERERRRKRALNRKLK